LGVVSALLFLGVLAWERLSFLFSIPSTMPSVYLAPKARQEACALCFRAPERALFYVFCD
jgi:hypothetical protein